MTIKIGRGNEMDRRDMKKDDSLNYVENQPKAIFIQNARDKLW